MKAGIISDIHANLIALEKVLAKLDDEGVDLIFCLGDITTLGPDPVEVLDIVMERKMISVLGNHDDFMIHPSHIKEYTDSELILSAVDWARDRLGKVHFEYFSKIPLVKNFTSESGNILLCHGSPRSYMDDIYETTKDSELKLFLKDVSSEIVLTGHTHLQLLKKFEKYKIVNPGSVGLPFKKRFKSRPEIKIKADYAIVESGLTDHKFRFESIFLDKEELLRRSAKSDNPFSRFLTSLYS